MIQKITQNNWNFWTVNLIMRAKKLLTSRQIFRYAVPARTVTKKHWLLPCPLVILTWPIRYATPRSTAHHGWTLASRSVVHDWLPLRPSTARRASETKDVLIWMACLFFARLPEKNAFAVNKRSRSYDTIRYDICYFITCARKPTWVGLIYRTETTTKNWKTKK